MNSNYWLEGWLHGNRIRSVDQSMKIIKDPVGFSEIVSVANQWHQASPEIKPSEETLLAGPGLTRDLERNCNLGACFDHTIDDLFRYSIPYYSDILMPDTVGELLNSDHLLYRTHYDHIRFALEFYERLRTVRALPLINFYPRQNEYGIKEIDYSNKNSQAQLLRASVFELSDHFRHHLNYGLTYEWVGKGNGKASHISNPDKIMYFSFDIWDLDSDTEKSMVVDNMLNTYFDAFLKNFYYANKFNLSIGHTDPLFGNLEKLFYFILQQRSLLPDRWPRFKDSDKFIQEGNKTNNLFKLPTLSGIPLNLLIELRLNYPEKFEQIRKIFRDAMSEAPQDEDTGMYLDTKILKPQLKEMESILKESAQKITREFFLGVLHVLFSFWVGKLDWSLLWDTTRPLVALHDYRKQKKKNPFSMFLKVKNYIHK